MSCTTCCKLLTRLSLSNMFVLIRSPCVPETSEDLKEKENAINCGQQCIHNIFPSLYTLYQLILPFRIDCINVIPKKMTCAFLGR